jgi:hypothetical protein
MRTPDQPGHSAASAPTRPKRTVAVSIGTLFAIAAVAFLVGFLPMWWTAQTRGNDLEDLSARHAELQLESTLARAALLARQGEYEAAREAASQFFTELNRAVLANAGNDPHLEARRAALTDRDEIITMLARSDPAAADRLAELYMTFRSARALPTQ